MTPQEHAKLEAEHEEHMAKFCRECAEADNGMFGAVWAQARIRYSESARYWGNIEEK